MNTKATKSSVDHDKVEKLSEKIASVAQAQAVAEESRKGILAQLEEARRESREANVRLELAIKSLVGDVQRSVNVLSDEIKNVSKTDSARETRYSWMLAWIFFAIAGSLIVIAATLLWYIITTKFGAG